MDTVSASASGLYRYAEDTNLLLALAHSQRTPTVEELYSNIESDSCAEPEDEHDLIAHFATNRLEIGNPNARREKSNNLELGLRRFTGRVTGELNLFYNSINDYVYLQDTGDFEDGVQIARIDQRDAIFRGIEAEIRFGLSAQHWERTGITLFGDHVRARFEESAGGSRNVPRIPAYRFGAELSHAHDNWVYKVRATRVGAQNKVALNETPTDAHTLLGVVVDYHARVMNQEVLVFLKGNNLLDEEVRNHASPLKDVAPQAGRGFEIGLRLDF
jgi:iron complex outermembrane recepter protein